MNSYWIKTKEVAKKGYFIDGKSKEDALDHFFDENYYYETDGMDEVETEVVEVQLCGTDITRNQRGKIIDSVELRKERDQKNQTNRGAKTNDR